jgi:crotonobetainyl-CoA:carnitine CoA-transferase CaiB-like acyl-CoA transferase
MIETPGEKNDGASTKPLPLDGVRVVDFSRLLPGPCATQMLGELGADTVGSTPTEFARQIESDILMRDKRIKESGIRAD